MKTKKCEFEAYEREVRRLCDVFGLNDWDLEFELKEKMDGAQASVAARPGGRMATFNLSSDPETISRSMTNLALHEVMHLVLADLGELAESRYTTEEGLTLEQEKVVTRLVNVLEGWV